MVTFDRQALVNLLMDHSRMLDALHNSGRVDISKGDWSPRPAASAASWAGNSEGGGAAARERGWGDFAAG